LKGQAVQLVGGEEHAVLEHIVHLEIRAQLLFIEGVLLLANLFRVIGPVGSIHLEVAAFGVDHLLDIRSFGARIGHGRRSQLPQQLVDRLDVACGLVLQHIVGVVLVTEQGGALSAQLYRLRHDGAVVVVSAMTTAVQGSLHDALAQFAIRERCQRRLSAGVHQRDHELAVELARLGRFRSR
jgi:hypothetical protein